MENWKPYKFLWSRIGGQPWTTIARAFCYAKKNFLPLMLGFMAFGWFIGAYLRNYYIPILVGFIFGLLVAHFFW